MSKFPIDRYHVMIKRYSDAAPRVVSKHRALCAAGRMLGSFISGKRRPADLQWCFVRDICCGGENVPGSSAVLSRNQILRVCGS